jgi:hypothetical protein
MMRVDGTACSCEPVNRFECFYMLYSPTRPLFLPVLIDNAMKEPPIGPDAPLFDPMTVAIPIQVQTVAYC